MLLDAGSEEGGYTVGMQEQKRIGEVLERLVCPVCHGRLELQQSCVLCTACGRSYPIEDGIPVLLEVRASMPERN